MPLLDSLARKIRLPAIAAPMFLTSGPDLVVEVCRGGLVGTFPTLNCRSAEGLRQWLSEIDDRLKESPEAAPYGVNLVVHRSNSRLAADLEAVVRHQVPLVITSLGAASEVVAAVHGYGGLVFHDVISRRHAEKAAEAGVDGIVAVAAGAGGHAGTLNPFALIAEIRAFYSGTLVLAGAIATGAHIAAARLAGADMAYLGTRFIAARESMASEDYKQMVATARAGDIMLTPNLSGVPANFLRQSIVAAGLDPDNIPLPGSSLDVTSEKLAWKTVWSAGHGVAAINDVLPAAEICRRLREEYRAAMRTASSDRFA